MNRRNFIKSGISLAGITGIMGITPILANSNDNVPLYKQFDWISLPVAKVFRVEIHPNGEHMLACVPIAVMTEKLNLCSGGIDLTEEKFTSIVNTRLELPNGIINYSDFFKQTYYTNELLLNAAKELGFTHLYCFGRVYTADGVAHYYVRGAKFPEWKTINGQLKVVEVNEEGRTEREVLTNKWSGYL